ncbi:MAG: phosphatidylserine/phosphatidylglycerophosphate/cardiolipin synthase family protein [Clostridia bacterium]|nr:phosphatidylserine/phosphatidylglycerophosphate/cardiolipin synthase family protein [Clostridia bacterium]
MKSAQLLTDGKNAFPAIIKDIDEAEKSVYINMFIWRDDAIGNRMAEAVLKAAERGVKVTIVVDRFAAILEKAEECRKTFFHKKLTAKEKLLSRALARVYPYKENVLQKDEETPLYKAILSHPNIRLLRDEVKKDHSKFYVIDDKILIFGGINIEDKETHADFQGRVYRDFMARFEGEDVVAAFWRKMYDWEDCDLPFKFCVNTKKDGKKLFEVGDAYLGMVRRAEKRIVMVCPYLSPLKPLFSGLKAAHARGVKIDLLIPTSANLQNDCNRRTAAKLKSALPNLNLYVSPQMVHAKVLICDNEYCFGSANFNNTAFYVLRELNLWGNGEPKELFLQLEQSVKELFDIAEKVTDPKRIKYSKFRALIESRFA